MVIDSDPSLSHFTRTLEVGKNAYLWGGGGGVCVRWKAINYMD